MKYTINEDRILEILEQYDEDFYIENNVIYLEYVNHKLELDNDGIEDIKNNHIDKEDTFIANMITKLLHPYFNECFVEIERVVSLQKCVEFLERLKFKIEKENDNFFVYTHSIVGNNVCKNGVKTNLNDVVNRLNNVANDPLIEYEDGIYTMLDNNREELMED